MSADNKKQSPTTITQLVESGSTGKVDDIEVSNSSNEVKDFTVGSTGKYRHKVAILDRLLAENMLVPGGNLGPDFQDDYRRIKRPLLSNACGRNKSLVDRGNLILVTSSIPGEGKTYTAVNLALSIAQ